MDYYSLRREVAQAVFSLIEQTRERPDFPFDAWLAGMMVKYGVTRRMILQIMEARGFTVENNRVVQLV